MQDSKATKGLIDAQIVHILSPKNTSSIPTEYPHRVHILFTFQLRSYVLLEPYCCHILTCYFAILMDLADCLVRLNPKGQLISLHVSPVCHYKKSLTSVIQFSHLIRKACSL